LGCSDRIVTLIQRRNSAQLAARMKGATIKEVGGADTSLDGSRPDTPQLAAGTASLGRVIL